MPHPFHGRDKQVVEGAKRGLAQGAGAARQRGAAIFGGRHGVAEQAGHALAAPAGQTKSSGKS